jgi:hypothetical protein
LTFDKLENAFNITKRYKTKNIIWETFDQRIIEYLMLMSGEIQLIDSEQKLNCFVDKFTLNLINICDNTLPKASNTVNKKSNNGIVLKNGTGFKLIFLLLSIIIFLILQIRKLTIVI